MHKWMVTCSGFLHLHIAVILKTIVEVRWHIVRFIGNAIVSTHFNTTTLGILQSSSTRFLTFPVSGSIVVMENGWQIGILVHSLRIHLGKRTLTLVRMETLNSNITGNQCWTILSKLRCLSLFQQFIQLTLIRCITDTELSDKRFIHDSIRFELALQPHPLFFWHKVLFQLFWVSVHYISIVIMLFIVLFDSTADQTILPATKSGFMPNEKAFFLDLNRQSFSFFDLTNTVDLDKSAELRICILQVNLVTF